jgi:hypothetical protein
MIETTAAGAVGLMAAIGGHEDAFTPSWEL